MEAVKGELRRTESFGGEFKAPPGALIPEEFIPTPYPGGQNMKALRIEFTSGIHDPDRDNTDMTLWIDCHRLDNCTCHKLAAITFYEYTPDGKYKQVPIAEGYPDTDMIVLGKVEELMIHGERD